MDFVPGQPGALTLLDTNFTLQDDGDPTKQLQFQLSGITTGTTRTLTIPNASSTIAVLGLAQSYTALQTFSSGVATTTLSASGQITSTLVTGTPPLVIASTTNVANLNASSLNGATFAAPGAIGSGTPSTGAFTTLTNSGLMTATGGITIADNVLTVQDNGDATKQLQFQLSGITTLTTRTLTVPDQSSTIAVLAAQTFTGKQTFDLGSGATVVGNLGIGIQILLISSDGGSAGFGFESYGNIGSGFFQSFAAGGTRASPTATTAGTAFYSYSAFGYDGIGPNRTSNKGYWQLTAGSLWSATNNETFHQWAGVPSGTTAQAEWMRLVDGNLLIGGTTTITGTGGMKIYGTTDASALDTGALRCLGGASISKSLWVGTTSNFAGTVTLADINMALGTTTGSKIGTSVSQKLGFWNATPIVQPSGATQAAMAAYVTGAFGLDSNAHMQALYDLVAAMRTALVNSGIMKGAA